MDVSLKGERILKTVNLYACFFCCGMGFSIFGPTLIDLQHLVNTDVKHISIIITAMFGGALIGGLSGGTFFDMTNKKQLTHTIFNVIACLTIFGMPWSKSLAGLAVWVTLFGIAVGVVVIGGNARIMDYWGEDSKPYFQALQLSYSIGSLIGPAMAAPFLGHYPNSTEPSNSSKAYSDDTYIQSKIKNVTLIDDTTTDAPSKVIYIFIIIGALFILETLYSVFITISFPVDENNQKGVLLDSEDRSLRFKIVLMTLGCILTSSIQALIFSYTQMLTVFATKGFLRLKAATGSYMTSIFFVAGTISRFLAVLISIKFSIFLLIVINLLLMVFGVIVLVLLAEYHEWALWLTTILIGAGTASLFSAIISWMENYIIMTNKVMGILDAGASLSGMILPYTIGQFIVQNPNIFNYVCLTCCIIAVIATGILYLVLRKATGKYIGKDKS